MKPFRTNSIIIILFILIPLSAISKRVSPLLRNISIYESPKNYPHLESSTKDTGTIKAFDLIKMLAGDWTGTFQWTGGRSAKGKMDARYYLTGNGSAVIEDLLMEGKPMMTSVYHLDGSSLRMTHYCAAGNQPRLKANSIDEGKKAIHFEFVDATNLLSSSDPHVFGLELQFRDDDHISLIFAFRKADVESYEHVELFRTKSN